MKLAFRPSRSPVFLLLAATAFPLAAADLLVDDFESYTADTVPGTTIWTTNSSGTNLMVRDDVTATPFGATNQYLEGLDADGTSIRLQSGNFTELSGSISTFSFDFNEPSTGGSDDFLFGYSRSGQDLNTAGRYLQFGLKDGAISSKMAGGLSGGGATSYLLDASYTIYVILNDTAAEVANYYGGETLGAGEADVWLDTLGTGSPVFVGTSALGALDSAYRVGFRTFTAALQEMLIDNARLETGIGGPMGGSLPPIIPPAGQPRSQTVVAGTGLIHLSVTPDGDGPITYQWKLGGIEIPGATGRTLSIDTPEAGEAGDYTVEVTNANGTTPSVAATVTLGTATPSLVDNFDSYSPGFLETVGTDWIVHSDANGYYEVVDGGGGDNYLGALDDDGAGTAPAVKILGTGDVIPNGSTSTFFSRVYRDSAADGSLWFGLADTATGGYNAFEGYVTFSKSGTIGIRDGGDPVNATTSLTADTWYNMWMVHNNATDTMQVFLTSDDRDATLVDRLESASGQVEFAFRYGTGDPLTHIQLINRNTTGPYRVDEFYMSPLANLAYPVGMGGPLGPIAIEILGNDAVLTWPGAGVLQSNDDLLDAWSDVDGGTATSPHTVAGPLGSRDFFRLRE